MEDDPSQPVWERKRAPKDLRELWLSACKRMLSDR